LFGKKIVSLPFIDTIYTKIITREDLLETENFEIRLSEINPDIENIKRILLKEGFNENIFKGHIVSELTSEKDFWERFHKHTRNDIRKAEKSGLILKKIDSKRELEKFYEIYFEEMKRFGTPQHSQKFFENCLEIMEESFVGWNCYKDDKIIGTITLFVNEDYVYVPFNISDINFRDLRPNDLLYWESIKWCIKNNKKFFDIGQIDLEYQNNSREESLIRFKRKWLGKEYRRLYFTRGFKIEYAKKDKLKKFRAVWKNLPRIIIKLIGPKICSNLI
jgi:lipid II:glycine glycyltransferase (peptidoglycan interpeptide bridge formation enzyme)